MTPQRLRSKMRKIRQRGEEMAEEGGELNLVPYLDIVTNVIMFMLATATFAAALGDINVSSPITSNAVSAVTNPEPPKPELNLTVSISDKGFTIAYSGGVLYEGFSVSPTGDITQAPGEKVPTIPKKGNEYDYDLLNKKILEIKKAPAAANETKMLVNANANIIYDVVVQTLDACRGTTLKPDPADPSKTKVIDQGFADVSLMAGVN